jgi:hypothetical protein
MAHQKRNRQFESIYRVAAFRAGIALKTVQALVPNATPRQKKRIANRILTLCDGHDRTVKITPAQAQDLILPHVQCVSDVCPQLCFWEPISRSLNMFFSDEE